MVNAVNHIYGEWRRFVKGVPLRNPNTVSPVILDSWERCRSYRVDPYLTKVSRVLEEEELKELLEQNAGVIDVSLPFMKNLYCFLKGSGFIVALFDANAYILKIVGDDDVLESVKRGNFVLGSCWSEETAGTNAAGTVLTVKRSLQIFGHEHYCINSHKWTGSGSPIHDAEGKMIGVIAMTGPHEKANPHTLGMVVAAAHAIENDIRLRKVLTEYQIAESFQKTVISSIPEIIMTINNDGVISLINNNAKKAFGTDASKFLGRNINDIWSKNNKGLLTLINHNDSLTDVEVRVSCRNSQSDFTLTCNPIMSMNKVTGKIVILNEIKRARTLATKMMGAKAKFNFEDMIGQNPRFLETVRQAQIASQINSNVLLLGESGTGKDIFAQAIHNSSSRRDDPYVAINCATIPRDLITSELFGYSDGAFTGSRRGGSQGKFELADGGTIFLDEIGEMPLELQAALLRVIEDKSIIRLGGTKVTTVDVRIIAATNKNLKEAVRQGKFREDLYYRSNVFTIRMVPLRERKDDIPLLVDCFVKNISIAMGKSIETIDEDVLERLMNFQWPGNIRELQNVLERMINISHSSRLTVDLLPPEIVDDRSMESEDHGIEPVSKMEHKLIMKMLKLNITKKEMARKMGISRSTLYHKLEKYGFNNMRDG
ncbi:MAG TPA: sigma-54-dependent Fis family transcriptional regulator [Syntrophales bacterium]|nr:sigma-54-dependent Fis family transcriptional regulator [Syntrophales bacterium]